MRPAREGEYRFSYFYSLLSGEKAAESAPFRVAAPADVCGVCGGNGRSCVGCDGVPNSGRAFDRCGVCGGADACVGCDGVPFSGARHDACGDCRGNGGSCTGCDGIPRPGGGLQADSCGVCGGHDRSCGQPPAVGTAPPMFDFVCAKPQIEIWWRAPSNRSRADYIAVCPVRSPNTAVLLLHLLVCLHPSIPTSFVCVCGTFPLTFVCAKMQKAVVADFSPLSCVVVVENLSGNRGHPVVQVPAAMMSAGFYELRYFSRTLGSKDFTVMARGPYEVTNNPARCLKLEYGLRADKYEYCTAQDVTLHFRVPAALTDLELKQAVVGLVEGSDPHGDPCFLCAARGVPCIQCFARVCAGEEDCQPDGTVVLPGGGAGADAVALVSPSTPGETQTPISDSGLAIVPKTGPLEKEVCAEAVDGRVWCRRLHAVFLFVVFQISEWETGCVRRGLPHHRWRGRCLRCMWWRRAQLFGMYLSHTGVSN